MHTSEQAILGMTIQGRYRLETLLGKGGYGAVYKAKHLKMGNDVAIKVLHATHGESEEIVKRFELEAQRSCTLRHPNTIRVFDFGRADNNQLFLAMEFLDGVPLGDVLQDGVKLPADRVVHIISQVLRALSEAHDLGLVHRDLKPDNIFLTQIGKEKDFVKVLDFGIAKAVNSGGTGLTMTGAVIGTPKYMSPEQCYGRDLDGRSDLYAVGCILFQMLAGRPPFVADEPMAYLLQHAQEPPPDIRELAGPDHPIPTGLVSVVNRLLAKTPDERFATADETLQAIQTSLTGDVTWDFKSPTTQAAGLMSAHSSTSQRLPRQPADTMTGHETTLDNEAGLDAPPRRKRWPLLAALALLIGGGATAAAIALGGSDPATTTTPTVAADVQPKRSPTADEPSAGKPAADEPPADKPATEEPPADKPAVAAAPAQEPAAAEPAGPKILQVIVDSEPPMAEVEIAGDIVGTTPYTVKWLSSGDAPKMTVKRRGYKPLDVALSVEDADKTYTVKLEKTKAPTKPTAAHRPSRPHKPAAGASSKPTKPKFNFERVDDAPKPKPKPTKKFDFAPVD